MFSNLKPLNWIIEIFFFGGLLFKGIAVSHFTRSLGSKVSR